MQSIKTLKKKKRNFLVTNLSIRGTKLNISLDIITQSHIVVSKTIGLDSV